MTIRSFLLVSAVLGLSVMGCTRSRDGGGVPLDVKGLNVVLPVGWTSVPPASSMRLAQVAIEGPGGPAELAVFHFGTGQGGDIEANIQRWLGQIAPRRAANRSARSSSPTACASPGSMPRERCKRGDGRRPGDGAGRFATARRGGGGPGRSVVLQGHRTRCDARPAAHRLPRHAAGGDGRSAGAVTQRPRGQQSRLRNRAKALV